MTRTDLGGALLCGLADALANAEDPGDPAVTLRGSFSAFFSQHRYAAVLVEGPTITINRRFLEDTPELSSKLASLHSALTDRGLGGLLLGGNWNNQATQLLADAFGGAPTGPRTAVAKGLGAISSPALAQVLGPGDARFWPADPGRSSLNDRCLASFCHSRLVALANATLRATHEGRSPDLYADSLLLTLRQVVEGLERPAFARRLLSMPLLPSHGQASHAANVTALSLAMGNLLGLERPRLLDLGFAAFFHDLGRAHVERKAGSNGEDRGAAEGHVLEGLRACLRGDHSRAAELRLTVVGEHHLRPDGYPTPVVETHALTDLISVADAYDRLERGVPWRNAVAPASALAELRASPDRYGAEAVELLACVLGDHPRGSFVRTPNGGVLLVVDGGAWRGNRPVARVLMLGDGSAAGRGLISLDDPNGYEHDDADLKVLGFKPWKIALGKEPLELEPGEWPEDEPTADELTPEQLAELQAFVDALSGCIEQFALYPAQHQDAQKSAADLHEALAGLLASQPKLTLELNVRGVCVQGAVVKSPAESQPLLDALRPYGVGSLTFRQGVDMGELARLATTLAGTLLSQETDPCGALWGAQLRHITWHSRDPHGPSAVEAESDRLESELLELISGVLQQAPAGNGETDAFCESLRDSDGAPSPAALAALPSGRSEYFSSPEGSARMLFLDRASAPVHMHALRIAKGAERDCSPDDVATFQAAMVQRLLWEGSLDQALDVLEAIAGEGDLPPTLAKALSDPTSLHLLVRRLRESGRDPDVGGGVALLNLVGPRAVDTVCNLYDTLTGEEELRRLLATYLVPHLRLDPAPLVPLSLNEDTQIAREALILMGVGGPGSQGAELLKRFASEQKDADAQVVIRCRIAREVLSETVGSDVRGQLLETLCRGEDKAQRIAAAVELGTVGNSEVLDQLAKHASSRELAARDDDEIAAVLQTLSQVGGGRAVKILDDLARGGRFALGKATRRIAKVASDQLSALRDGIQQEKTQRIYLKGVCARCKFENIPGAESCLQCGSRLTTTPKVGNPPARQGTSRFRRPTVKLRRPDLDEEPEAKRSASGRIKRAAVDARNLAAAQKSSATVEALAWLSYPLLPPVPLGPKPMVTIGRGADCELELLHDSVSRSHVVIRIAGERMILEDRSSYGTWVNGKRTMNTEIKPGDVITVGPYDISVEPGRIGANRNSDTRPLRTFASSEAIGGRLERVSLAEVLQQIEFNEKTGTLEVFTDDDHSGLLVIYEGKPMYAELAELRDQEAVLRMLTLKKGNFSFRAKVEAGEMTMAGMTLTGLLMEASRVIDEAGLG